MSEFDDMDNLDDCGTFSRNGMLHSHIDSVIRELNVYSDVAITIELALKADPKSEAVTNCLSNLSENIYLQGGYLIGFMEESQKENQLDSAQLSHVRGMFDQLTDLLNLSTKVLRDLRAKSAQVNHESYLHDLVAGLRDLSEELERFNEGLAEQTELQSVEGANHG